MSILNWFGAKEFSQHNPTTIAVENLLSLYSNSVAKYLGLEGFSNVHQLMDEARKKTLKKGDLLFVEWFERSLDYIKKLSEEDLPDNELLVSQLEYDYFILEQEFNMSYPDDLRSCLVDILNELPNRIREAKLELAEEVFSVKEKYNSTEESFRLENNRIKYRETQILENTRLVLEDYGKDLSNTEEPASVPVLFLLKFERRGITC